MVKSVLGVNHQGLRDFLIQRISALVMIVYLIFMLGFFVSHPQTAYHEWHGLFSALWMKAATLILMISLLYHAWVGMWTVFTDYVKPFWLRLILHWLVIFALIAFFLVTLFILWGV